MILLTRIANDRADWKQGIEYGEQAIEQSPDDSEAHFVYAVAIRNKMQKVSKMKAMFSLGTYKKELVRAIELDPRNVEARSEQIGFLINAPGFAGGSTSKAREKIAELKPLDWREAMLFEAEIAGAEDDAEEERRIYEQMLERDKDDESVRMRLAMQLQGAGNYAEADRHLRILAESDDSRRALSARYQIARSRIIGEYETQQAVDALLAYIKQLTEPVAGLPSKSSAYWRLGMAYEQQQRIEEARRAYQTALDLDADNKQARASLKKLPRG